MDVCIHIGTGSVPGLAHAHGPPKCTAPTSVTSWWGLFMPARWRACRDDRALEVSGDLLYGLIALVNDPLREMRPPRALEVPRCCG